MRKILAMAAAVAVVRAAFAIAASQAWVSNYVARAISQSRAEIAANTDVAATNGVTVIEAGSGDRRLRLTWEEPTDAALVTETDDRALAGFWRPAFTFFARLFQRAHLLQSGSLHLYILLILVTVVVLLTVAFAS